MALPMVMLPATVSVAMTGAGPFVIPAPAFKSVQMYIVGFVNGDLAAQTGTLSIQDSGPHSFLVAALGASQILTYPGTGISVTGPITITASAALTTVVFAQVAYI